MLAKPIYLWYEFHIELKEKGYVLWDIKFIARLLLGLFFDSEDEVDISLQNVSLFSTDYTALADDSGRAV
jgi:hypothetical protein